MKGIRLGTTDHMLHSSKMVPLSRPCNSDSPRTKPPRPGFWLPADRREFIEYKTSMAGGPRRSRSQTASVRRASQLRKARFDASASALAPLSAPAPNP